MKYFEGNKETIELGKTVVIKGRIQNMVGLLRQSIQSARQIGVTRLLDWREEHAEELLQQLISLVVAHSPPQMIH